MHLYMQAIFDMQLAAYLISKERKSACISHAADRDYYSTVILVVSGQCLQQRPVV